MSNRTPDMVAEHCRKDQEDDARKDKHGGPLIGGDLQLAQAVGREREVDERLDHLRPPDHGQHRWNAGPYVVKRDDNRAEDETQEGGGKHSGLAALAQEDEEVDPRPWPDGM